GDTQAHDWHVRDRAVGPSRSHTDPDPRSARHQAAVLGKIRQAFSVRLGDKGVTRASRLDSTDRSQCGRRVHAAQLHSGAAYDLPRRPQARTWNNTYSAVAGRAANFSLLE